MASHALAPVDPLGINGLPTEALAMILAWVGPLNNTSLWRDVPRVCKLWAEICRTHPLGVHMEFDVYFSGRLFLHLGAVMAQIKASASRHYHPRTTVIHITGRPTISNTATIAKAGAGWINGIVFDFCRTIYECISPIVKLLVKYCPNLIHVGLPVPRGFGLVKPEGMDEELAILCRAFPNLETLDISNWPISSGTAMLPLTGCKALRGLKINYHGDGLGLAGVMEGCPNLSLANVDARGMTDRCLRAEQKARGPRVTAVSHLQHSFVTPTGFDQFLEACPNVTTVRLCNPNNPGETIRSVAARCSKLATLKLEGTDHWDTYTDAFLQEVALACRRTLTHLVLHDCYRLTSDSLATIGTVLGPTLTTLRLRLSHFSVNSSSYIWLFTRCVALKHLEVTSSRHELTRRAVDTLTKHCLKLETLKLGFATESHGFGGFHRFGSLLQLRELRLKRCINTPVENAFRVLSSTCTLLTTLEIHSVHVLSDRDVRPIVRGLKSLEVLSLYPTTATLTRRSFGKGQAPLKQLTLHRNAGMCFGELSAIIGLLPALQVVDVSWCRRIQAKHAKQLMLQHLGLTVVCRGDCSFFPVAKYFQKRLLGVPLPI
jgi:hypothetical protein